MAEKKYLDENGVLYLWQKVLNKLTGKVDVVDGKTLSTNDYTDTEKTKLAGIEEGANKTTVDSALSTSSSNPVQNSTVTAAINNKANSSDLSTVATSGSYNDLSNKPTIGSATITIQKNGSTVDSFSVNATSNKSINITVPTDNSSLTNGAGYQTASDVSTAISDAISDITSFKYEIVTSLPTTGVTGTIYLISNGGSSTNIYDEYIYINSKWEKIGTTDVDLSGYQKSSELVAITNSEIDEIVAS